jgi:hypothetical protein
VILWTGTKASNKGLESRLTLSVDNEEICLRQLPTAVVHCMSNEDIVVVLLEERVLEKVVDRIIRTDWRDEDRSEKEARHY